MPGGVEVHITDAAIISALNTPGGAVHEWRDERRKQVLAQAIAGSPVNDPLNALHRGGVVGIFKASWGTQSSERGHRVGFAVYNTAPHAAVVEFGRAASTEYQRFSWAKLGGKIKSVGGRIGGGTRRRGGYFVLGDAVNEIGTRTGDWTPTI